MRKIAVTLAQLRTASKAMSEKVVRRAVRDGAEGATLGPVGKLVGPSGVNKALAPEAPGGFSRLGGKVFMKGDQSKFLKGFADSQVRGLGKMLPGLRKPGNEKYLAKATEGIRNQKDLSRSISRLDPRGKEAFNRVSMLHEGVETRVLPREIAPMASHLSPGPPLNDLNIAATLKGPGSSAGPVLRRLRAPEAKEMEAAIPGLSSMNLGKERVSRHAIRRISEIMKRKQQG